MVALLIAVALAGSPTDLPGFQESRWGMTAAEVQRLFPTAKPLTGPALLRAVVEVAGDKKPANFSFDDGGLLSVNVTMQDGGTIADRAQAFVRLLGLLGAKYGVASLMDGSSARTSVWKDAGEIQTAIEKSDLGLVSASWMAGQTMVSLTADKYQVTVGYLDNNHAAHVMQAKTKGL